ncbi:hypothetical protein B0H16DRAFT_1807819 [Mycena metata]|uniref:Uncharacterized protein n=1 Tax=Mycena metata TaxID=1033252 RepID=A0AAD7MFK9_9AGAR|nr:hypothetical protein B0H16DRAFT_1807819 [Mycena metata]
MRPFLASSGWRDDPTNAAMHLANMHIDGFAVVAGELASYVHRQPSFEDVHKKSALNLVRKPSFYLKHTHLLGMPSCAHSNASHWTLPSSFLRNCRGASPESCRRWNTRPSPHPTCSRAPIPEPRAVSLECLTPVCPAYAASTVRCRQQPAPATLLPSTLVPYTFTNGPASAQSPTFPSLSVPKTLNSILIALIDVEPLVVALRNVKTLHPPRFSCSSRCVRDLRV